MADLPNTNLPTEADEIWRYSRVGSLELGSYQTLIDVPAQILGAVPGPATMVRLVPEDRDVFSRLVARAAASQEIRFPAGTHITEPVSVLHDLDSAHDAIGVSRLVVVAEPNAHATVIHRIRSSSDVAGLFLPEIDLHIGAGASVRYVIVQELGPKAVQIGTQSSVTSRDASLSSMAVSLGGNYARLRFDATMSDKGGHNELLAVYYAEGTQMHDFRTVQHHVAPRTTSDLVFKGAVSGHGRSVYSGLIKIGPDARGTSANQTNRNLLLSPDASAESVPNLEIENNDVKCSHASAIGPISDDERYYLESRGVPSTVADRLIVLGFFADLLSRIPGDELRSRLIATITDSVDRAMSTAGKVV